MTSTIHYTADDMLQARFVTRPLPTVALSAVVALNPGEHPSFRRWSDYVRETLPTEAFATLRLLLTGTSCLPDFLKPFPGQEKPTFANELGCVAAMPDDYIEQELLWLCRTSPPVSNLRYFFTRPRLLRDQVIDELNLYWRQVVKPQWPHLRTLLQSDVLYRARRLLQGGYALMLSELSYQLDVGQHHLTVQTSSMQVDLDLQGEGIILEPNIFADRLRIQTSSSRPGVALTYPARGAAIWRATPAVSPAAEISQMLGETRTKLLLNLVKPATTQELALVLGLTPGAISRQLSQLLAAGVLQRQRAGKRVYYGLNQRGEALLEIFHADDDM